MESEQDEKEIFNSYCDRTLTTIRQRLTSQPFVQKVMPEKDAIF